MSREAVCLSRLAEASFCGGHCLSVPSFCFPLCPYLEATTLAVKSEPPPASARDGGQRGSRGRAGLGNSCPAIPQQPPGLAPAATAICPSRCLSPVELACLTRVQELTAAEAGDAALQEHSHFAEQLWDQTAVILDRIAIGLSTTGELIAFFKARQAAEEAVATNLRKMCLVSARPAPSKRRLSRPGRRWPAQRV